MYILKNAIVYSPKYLGKKDLLIAGNKIQIIDDEINLNHTSIEIIDCKCKKLVPGFCDQHIHITGGGGEGSFKTRAPEINLSELISSGITTVVGLLGTDSTTRSIENLVAKTKALKEEGITAFALTGSYDCPTTTLTGNIQKDIVFIDEIIGTKIALSDHRSSNPSQEYFNYVASETRTAGMIGGKAGIVTVHMGSGKNGFKPIFDMLEQTDIPIKTVHPTHVGRCEPLLSEAFKYAKMGGMIDLTCGENDAKISQIIKKAIAENLPLENITLSTDSNGSWSNYDSYGNLMQIGVSSSNTMLLELKSLIKNDISLEIALSFITSNVAKGLLLYPNKGLISVNSDADLLLLDDDLNINMVIALGKIMLQDGKNTVYGTYEKH